MGLREVCAAVRFGEVVEGADRFVLSENARATVSAIYENLSVDSRASAGVAIAPEPDALRHQPGMMQAM
jgi:hypothetical protein